MQNAIVWLGYQEDKPDEEQVAFQPLLTLVFWFLFGLIILIAVPMVPRTPVFIFGGFVITQRYHEAAQKDPDYFWLSRLLGVPPWVTAMMSTTLVMLSAS